LGCDASNGEKTAAELTNLNNSLPVQFVTVDWRHPAEISQAIEAVRKAATKIDILVNNVGVEIEKSLEKLTIADWDMIGPMMTGKVTHRISSKPAHNEDGTYPSKRMRKQIAILA
jgi:NADP-dependent 3-hydroxy acid dehydrogenase YdfG